MSIIQKAKCVLGFHKEAKYHWTEKYPFRTTNTGRSKKRWHTVKVRITETYCEVCGKTLKRKRTIKW